MNRLLLLLLAGLVAATPASARGPSPGRLCGRAEVRGDALLQGATGSMLGVAVLRNVTSTRCVLTGQPRVELLGRDGRPLPVRERPFPRGQEAGSRLLFLLPRRRAMLPLQWFNWCPQATGILHLRLRLASGSSAIAVPLLSGGPRCDAPKLGSWIDVGFYEPR